MNQIPSNEDLKRIEELKKELLHKKDVNEQARRTLVECAIDEVILDYEFKKEYLKWKENQG